MIMNVEKIWNMPYADFVAIIKETNRCPGGKDTIRWIIQKFIIKQE